MRVAAELSELMKAVAVKDTAAFERLYRETSPKILSVVLRILQRRGAAEDVLAFTFDKIWQNADQLILKSAPALVVMTTIARHRAVEIVRRRLLPSEAEHEPVITELPDPDSRRDIGDDLRQVLAAVGELDADAQRIFLLAYYNGWSLNQLAQKQGVSAAIVRGQLRAHLRSIAAGLTLSETGLPQGQLELAAEFSLGILDIGERLHAEAMIQLDARFKMRVDDWDRLLGALNQMGGLVEPSAGVWAKLKRKIVGDSVADSHLLHDPIMATLPVAISHASQGSLVSIGERSVQIVRNDDEAEVIPARQRARPLRAMMLLLLGMIIGASAWVLVDAARPELLVRIKDAPELAKIVAWINRDWLIATGAVNSDMKAASLVVSEAEVKRPAQYMALLQSIRQVPAFILVWQEGGQALAVRRLANPPPDGHVYRLWANVNGDGPPRALGVIDAAELSEDPDRVARVGADMLTTEFGVSLDLASGAAGDPLIQYSGKLVQVSRGSQPDLR